MLLILNIIRDKLSKREKIEGIEDSFESAEPVSDSDSEYKTPYTSVPPIERDCGEYTSVPPIERDCGDR